MFSHIKELFTRPSGYTISRSVRLRSSASAYLNRTPASASNRQIWTWSAWIKRGVLGSAQKIFSAASSSLNYAEFEFISGDNWQMYVYDGAQQVYLTTSQVFRDPSAWYHIVVSVDTTQSTSTNRVKLYVNGLQVTSFSNASYPSLNYSMLINNTVAHNIFRDAANSNQYVDGYLTEINFIDGQALTPSSFGSTNATTGVWQPAKYTGTYGTNGFYLNFSDNSSNTATTIGKDYSGNGNNWTPNNISVTAGTTYDSMVDSPTVSAVSSNYCVMNPLDKYTNVTVSNGNLDSTFSAFTGFVRASFALPSTGKWYWEGTVPTTDVRAEFGIATLTQALGVDPQTVSGCWFLYSNGTNTFKFNGSGTSWGTAWASGDIIGIAFDADNGTLTFYKNNTLQGGGAAFTGLTGTYAPMVGFGNNTSTAISINFGQRPFTYTPPTGFVALNTYNLPASTITNGAAYMAATLYTGNGSTQSITNTVNGISFQPDYVWLKSRSTADNNQNQDSVRGATKRLFSNLTDAESTSANSLTSFNSNGFSVGADANYNGNGYSFVAWQWKAGGSSSSNTNGSITSTVSVGATQGFSVVSFTGVPVNASTSTIGHGLGVAPSFIILKNRDAVDDWYCQHVSLGASARISLNTTAAAVTGAGSWGNTAPTSTVFTIANNAFTTSTSQKVIAYCFAAVKGFSAFGSYTGNGSADGPFVYLGFRPRFILYKRTDAVTNWVVWDTSRNTYNVTNLYLLPNSSGAEGTLDTLDILSNGFKLRTTNADNNGSGGTFIYAAFAENPFKNSLAR